MGKKILTVDDSLTVRKMVEMAFRETGHTVISAKDGEEGLSCVAGHKPDIILLDFVLPDMQGVDFCKRLQEKNTTCTTPILLISGKSDAIRKLYQDIPNVVDYLTKPFAINVIRAVVSHILRGSESTPAEETSDESVSEGFLSEVSLPAREHRPKELLFSIPD